MRMVFQRETTVSNKEIKAVLKALSAFVSRDISRLSLSRAWWVPEKRTFQATDGISAISITVVPNTAAEWLPEGNGGSIDCDASLKLLAAGMPIAIQSPAEYESPDVAEVTPGRTAQGTACWIDPMLLGKRVAAIAALVRDFGEPMIMRMQTGDNHLDKGFWIRQPVRLDVEGKDLTIVALVMPMRRGLDFHGRRE